jgi:hypothetical protein
MEEGTLHQIMVAIHNLMKRDNKSRFFECPWCEGRMIYQKGDLGFQYACADCNHVLAFCLDSKFTKAIIRCGNTPTF